MAAEFTEQDGAASSTPSPLRRWLGSKVSGRLFSLERRDKQRKKAEAARRKASEPHRVEYFHQVDDPYSYLAVQVLPAFCERYDVELVCYLTRGPLGRNLPEPDLLPSYGVMDCEQVAPHYGLNFPRPCESPSTESVAQATRLLAAAPAEDFLAVAQRVCRALWHDEDLELVGGDLPTLDQVQAEARVEQGTARQAELKHFSGGMLYYGGEWYWGIDRLYHLEQRLVGLGVSREPSADLIVPRPAIDAGTNKDDGSLTLEIYPSLRSPYTSISFDKALAMAKSVNVKVVIKPVMPMVMRGVTLTGEKSKYIMTDTAREAAALGVSGFGTMYDPIGEPVKRAFSLYPWATAQGRGAEYISAFLQAAFFRGINTLKDSGQRWVVAQAGLSWAEAEEQIDKPGWEEGLEANRTEMYDWGSWGVPSFRLLGKEGEVICQFWGQDRLWVVGGCLKQALA